MEQKQKQQGGDLEEFLLTWYHGLDLPSELLTAIHVALFPGGKRIRPRLALGLMSDMQVNPVEWLPLAAVLEILHTSSLIHDDLPALDNDDFRRGRPTCHKVVGEGVALLTGDLLVPEAFRLIGDLKKGDSVERWFMLEAVTAYSELCHGQVLDLSQVARDSNLLLIHKLKTGALFRLALLFGISPAIGILRGEYYTACSSCGDALGVTFQLVDDYIDQFGTSQERGRPTSSDTKNSRGTLWSGMTYDDARAKLLQELHSLGASVEQLSVTLGNRPLPHLRAVVGELFRRVEQVTAESEIP